MRKISVPKGIQKISKRFIIRKWVIATSAQEALKIEGGIPADECWVDMEYERSNSTIGFKDNKTNE